MELINNRKLIKLKEIDPDRGKKKSSSNEQNAQKYSRWYVVVKAGGGIGKSHNGCI